MNKLTQNKIGKKGFTLIEMLVIILIVGVLAAIALPEYKNAVEKTRTSQAKTFLNAIYKNYQLCLVERSKSQCTKVAADDNIFTNGDIQIQGQSTTTCMSGANICVNEDHWQYAAKGTELSSSGLINGYRTNNKSTILYTIQLNVNTGGLQCIDGTEKFCESLCDANPCTVE